jgi:hypothetical protein
MLLDFTMEGEIIGIVSNCRLSRNMKYFKNLDAIPQIPIFVQMLSQPKMQS